jgi:hypothetical protein
MDREIADEHLAQSMSPTEDRHLKGELDEPPEHCAPLQPTPPPEENSALEDVIGLTVKNPARFEGVEDVDQFDEPPNKSTDVDIKKTCLHIHIHETTSAEHALGR